MTSRTPRLPRLGAVFESRKGEKEEEGEEGWDGDIEANTVPSRVTSWLAGLKPSSAIPSQTDVDNEGRNDSAHITKTERRPGDGGARAVGAEACTTPRTPQRSQHHDPHDEDKHASAITNSPTTTTSSASHTIIFDAARCSSPATTAPSSPTALPTPSSTSTSTSTAPPSPPRHVRLVSCLHCALASLPCSRGLPCCARCVRGGRVCLPRYVPFAFAFADSSPLVSPSPSPFEDEVKVQDGVEVEVDEVAGRTSLPSQPPQTLTPLLLRLPTDTLTQWAAKRALWYDLMCAREAEVERANWVFPRVESRRGGWVKGGVRIGMRIGMGELRGGVGRELVEEIGKAEFVRVDGGEVAR